MLHGDRGQYLHHCLEISHTSAFGPTAIASVGMAACQPPPDEGEVLAPVTGLVVGTSSSGSSATSQPLDVAAEPCVVGKPSQLWTLSAGVVAGSGALSWVRSSVIGAPGVPKTLCCCWVVTMVLATGS